MRHCAALRLLLRSLRARQRMAFWRRAAAEEAAAARRLQALRGGCSAAE
jgi:hypothetical protein